MNSHLTKPNPRPAVISIIAAVADNGVIGVNNALPWHLPADLRRVKALTTGHHIIMGRKNYESLGRPLPNRVNVVVTRNPGYTASGCVVAHSLEDALALARDDAEAFIFGGAEIYAQALAHADRIYLTLVHAAFSGDTLFPEFSHADWTEVERVRYEPDEHNPYPYTFQRLDRNPRR
jgi:dihydrofolate reductase